MSKEIHLVVASFGSHDSHYNKNIKAFTNKVEADAYCKKYNRIIKSLAEFLEENKEYVYNSDSIDTDEVINSFQYSIWRKYNLKYDEFNEVEVEKLELI